MEKMINHSYPAKLLSKKYPIRYTQETFDNYQKLIKTPLFIHDYEKWKIGINSKTGRKIKINGDKHYQLKERFLIKGRCKGGSYAVLFIHLQGIIPEIYTKATIDIYNSIDEYNKKIEAYNKEVDNIIEKINNLSSFNDFVIFNDQKYGLPPIVNCIHRTDDCLGDIKTIYKACKCHLCEDWNGCDNPVITCNVCEKCQSTV
jgi:hypothetical protein